MLERLSTFHDAILAAAEELESLAMAPEPDCARLAQVRFTIAKSSHARSRLLETTVYPTLLTYLGGADAAEVRRLRDERLRGLRETAEHVAEWGTLRIAVQWRDFQREVPRRLSGLRTSVRTEKTMLFPLIEKLGVVQPNAGRLAG